MRELIMVRFGEVHLKGLNRPYFLRMLVEDIKKALPEEDVRVRLADGRIYVSGFADMEKTLDRVSKVFGVYSVSPA